MTAENPLPLAGVRVIAVEQYAAGPYASMHLADQGAEVIKVEASGARADNNPSHFGNQVFRSQ